MLFQQNANINKKNISYNLEDVFELFPEEKEWSATMLQPKNGEKK